MDKFTTYILHWDTEIDKKNHFGDSKHYVGRTEDFKIRLKRHLSGYGAVVTK